MSTLAPATWEEIAKAWPMWGEQKALELFAEAGFSDVEVKHVEGDIMNNYYIARP
jgi:Zn-dependent membrane protease YugP